MDTRIVEDFPQDDEYWMITWVNQITLIKSDYSLTVDVISVNQRVFEEKPYQSTAYNRKYRTLRIGLGFLPLAEIGSVWHNQQLFFSPSRSQNEQVTYLNIALRDPTRTSSVPLHKLAEAFTYLSSYHPFASLTNNGLGNSPCRIIKSGAFDLEDGKQARFLIFPPSEILRFYQCGSDSFVKHVIAGGIPSDDVYLQEATKFDPDTGTLFIRIRGHLRDSDALYAGRLAGDLVAHSEMVALSKYIQLNLINKRISYVDTGFPFAGPTILQVAGKWVKTNKNQWAFFVYSILHCSAQLPFQKLLFYRENDNHQTPNPETEEQATTDTVPQTHQPPADAHISSTLAPNTNLAKGELPLLLSVDQKFAQVPPIERVQKEQQLKKVTGRLPRWYKKTDLYTTGDGEPTDDGSTVGPVRTDVEEPIHDGKGVHFTQFHAISCKLAQGGAICQYLDYWNEWAISTCHVAFPYPYLAALSKKDNQWILMHPRDRSESLSQLKRRMIVLHIVYAGHTFYLLECETRRSESFSRMLVQPKDLVYNQASLLDALLKELVEKQGKWSKVIFPSNTNTQAIHHGEKDTPEAVALRVLTYIRQYILGKNKKQQSARRKTPESI